MGVVLQVTSFIDVRVRIQIKSLFLLRHMRLVQTVLDINEVLNFFYFEKEFCKLIQTMRDTEKELIEFDVIDKMGGVVTTRGWS